MFRRWLSSFWRKYKAKILLVLKWVGLAILVSLAAGAFLSQLLKNNTPREEVKKDVYMPGKTIISGENISKEELEKDDEIVKTFVNYCNEQKYEDAYRLLTKECKEKVFKNEKDFEESYCKVIFEAERQYNIQSWITSKNYNTYKVRFTDDFISTGKYDNTKKFEDYITVVTDNEDKKLNINGYIKTDELSQTTKTDEIEVEAIEKDTYLNYEVYTLNIKNKTENEMLLADLSKDNSIKLFASNEAEYGLSSDNLSKVKLRLNSESTKQLVLKFNKQYGSHISGVEIEFKKVIKDYDEYTKDSRNYDNYMELNVKL